ncbi:kinase-like protein, putative [Babesia ovata]|uniref:Kinase-like protein, putative n=1 Tax=Babesia ovata TaxID=189622 RepID=A0A2H6KCT8_9APIC|nr:kinase-like protein, putative [Babesia ovata]GBE60805.1 kinase-like protein, putative [Babesia ovata]
MPENPMNLISATKLPAKLPNRRVNSINFLVKRITDDTLKLSFKPIRQLLNCALSTSNTIQRTPRPLKRLQLSFNKTTLHLVLKPLNLLLQTPQISYHFLIQLINFQTRNHFRNPFLNLLLNTPQILLKTFVH